jgi:hypothetical protein
MAAPKKDIPEVVRQRMLQLSLEGYGSRRISKTIASEYGSEYKYSHTYIQNFLNDYASVANTFQQNETSTHTANPESSVEKAPLATQLQVPPRYVTPPSHTSDSSSTLIVQYPVPQDSVPPGDSIDQVFLDLFRAKGMAELQYQYQQRAAPVETTESKDQNPYLRLIEAVHSYNEQLEKKQQEETAKIFEAAKTEMNEHRKRMEAISYTIGTGTKSPANPTAEPESNLKDAVGNDQTPRNETTPTLQDTQAALMMEKKEEDSTAVTPSTVKSPEPTTINDSKKLDDATHEQAKQTESRTTTSAMSAMGPQSMLDPSKTSTTSVRNDGFSQQPDSTESETHFRILEPDQRNVANNIPEYTPPTPTEQKDQLQFKRIQAAQDAGSTGGAQNGDGGSSTNQLFAIVGLALVALGTVCGIDYLKGRANSKSSRQLKNNTIQPFIQVGSYSRVNDPDDAAIF